MRKTLLILALAAGLQPGLAQSPDFAAAVTLLRAWIGEKMSCDGLIELVPGGMHLCRMSGLNGNGELVRFELDDNGRVVRLWKGEYYMLPGGR